MNKITSIVTKAKASFSGLSSKVFAVPAVVSATATTLLMSASASEITVSPAVTTDMLSPIVDLISANIAVIMPVGIAIFGVMVGLGLVPRIVRMFLHG